MIDPLIPVCLVDGRTAAPNQPLADVAGKAVWSYELECS